MEEWITSLDPSEYPEMVLDTLWRYRNYYGYLPHYAQGINMLVPGRWTNSALIAIAAMLFETVPNVKLLYGRGSGLHTDKTAEFLSYASSALLPTNHAYYYENTKNGSSIIFSSSSGVKERQYVLMESEVNESIRQSIVNDNPNATFIRCWYIENFSSPK